MKMLHFVKIRFSLVGYFLLIFSFFPLKPSFSQSINPANDGTLTIVTPNGNEYIIDGGQLSEDGKNLFQSFQNFNLNSGEIATFLSTPQIQNILSRVVGGNPSSINGLIQILGGNNTNLYLMNPAGIIFGQNAQLNINGDFWATTADQIHFGTGVFDLINNNYSQLIGNPTGFQFSLNNPSPIINGGNLQVNTGQTLGMIGGTVVNTGNLTAEEGNIIVSAVKDSSLVKISFPNSLLSLEISPPVDAQGNLLPITPKTLLSLIKGQGTVNTGLSVNSTDHIILNSNQQIIPNDSGLTLISGNIDTSGISGGNIYILGNKVGLLSATVNAQGQNQGGNILIGGDYKGQGNVPNSQITVVNKDTLIQADATHNGNAGKVIVWADQTTSYYGNITAKGGLFGGNGGFVEVSGKDNLLFRGNVQLNTNNGQNGTLLLDPKVVRIVNGTFGTDDGEITDQQILAGDGLPPDTFTISEEQIESSLFMTGGDLIIEATEGIILEDLVDNQLNISYYSGTLGNISFIANADGSSTGNFTMNDPNDTIITGGRSISITGANLTLGSINTESYSYFSSLKSGDVTLTATHGIIQAENILTQTSTNYSTVYYSPSEIKTYSGGNVALNAVGDVNLENVTTYSNTGKGGSVNLTTSQGNIQTGNIDTSGYDANTTNLIYQDSNYSNQTAVLSIASGGQVGLSAVNGSIITGDLNSYGQLGSGISLVANTSIKTGNIDTHGVIKNGGDVTLDPTGDVEVGYIDAQGGSEGVGGIVDITAGGYFRAIDTFIDQNDLVASISTAGRLGGGNITIRHGGNGVVSFIVGDATTNGTKGVITSGNFTISSGEFPGNYTLGNINLITGSSSSSTGNTTQPDKIDFEEKKTGNGNSNSGSGNDIITLDNTRKVLQTITDNTGAKPAIIYINFVASDVSLEESFVQREYQATLQSKNQLNISNLSLDPHLILEPKPTDELELLLITAEGKPVRKRLTNVTRSQVIQISRQLQSSVTNVQNSRGFFAPSQKLYQWFIEPLLGELQERKINNLVFIPEVGLRGVPYASLYDGSKFLIESYSVGLMPSLSLTDTRYVDVRKLEVLAMGADVFRDQNPLPSVPTEIHLIAKDIWKGDILLNQDFTIENMEKARSSHPYGIIHLATHGDFEDGQLNKSFIQFWNQKLQLDQLRSLNLNDPPVELLVLSACRTALGSDTAELGFSGLATQAGVKSALGSLWYISDEGTLGFMTSFYHFLSTANIKAEAVREAQLAMLKGEVQIKNGKLITPYNTFDLPPNLQGLSDGSFTHPYYWSALTLVGNPW